MTKMLLRLMRKSVLRVLDAGLDFGFEAALSALQKVDKKEIQDLVSTPAGKAIVREMFGVAKKEVKQEVRKQLKKI